MIVERRVIVFPRADFLDAMRRYGERIGKHLPDTAPDLLSFDPSQDIALTIRFPAIFAGGSAKDFVFSRDDVGQALTIYCREHRVPLPKSAEKQIEKFKDGAALTMLIGSSGLQVMIIDDQEVMRSIIKKLLAKTSPAQIFEAGDGVKALEMLRSGDVDPDVIICDLHMDNMNGIEFLRTLRADKGNVNSRKPVLILTGDKSEQAHEITRQVGASKVLTKPIGADELIRQINLVRGHFETGR
ncbi:response regulator [Magnetospirillum sp. SS-4]|uniref:response regulator n=1 Tax=Magnetospirillum sp. SS-4 TaxID=2681465 RepID=UPI00138258A1|nr:response regulator [Magnetospirillum sp. SS-4]CAA7612854.1 CheY-like receiver [Magnetospirillum sp. SS-4]